MSNNILVAYVPVLHSGYIQLLQKHAGGVYLIGGELIRELSVDNPYYGRDIRAVDTEMMCKAIESLGIVSSVQELSLSNITKLLEKSDLSIIAPDEDISREVAQRYFLNKEIIFENIFLRWDKKITEREYEISPDRIFSTDQKDIDLIRKACEVADHSSDWWRQVGAVLVKDGGVLYIDCNRHIPSPHSPYVFGDPRNNYDVGQGPHYYTSIHAEAAVIARAAKDGVGLDGTALYASTFPCPSCARLIREAGIRTVYYTQGYSALDSEAILKEAGVEIIYVPLQK